MRIYISSHDADSAESLALALAEAGHEVVSTWHAGSHVRPDRTDAEAWRANADRNLMQVESADALVLIASHNHVARVECVPGGKFVEAGYAAGLMNGRAKRCRIITVGGVENGMLYGSDFTHVNDAADLIAALT